MLFCHFISTDSFLAGLNVNEQIKMKNVAEQTLIFDTIMFNDK